MPKSTQLKPGDVPGRTVEEFENNQARGINPLGKGLIDNTGGLGDSDNKKKKPEDEKLFIPAVADLVTLRDLRTAANANVEKLHALWLEADKKRKRDIAEATLNKTRLPDHYWQAEHEARMKYQAAKKFAEIIEPIKAK